MNVRVELNRSVAVLECLAWLSHCFVEESPIVVRDYQVRLELNCLVVVL